MAWVEEYDFIFQGTKLNAPFLGMPMANLLDHRLRRHKCISKGIIREGETRLLAEMMKKTRTLLPNQPEPQDQQVEDAQPPDEGTAGDIPGELGV